MAYPGIRAIINAKEKIEIPHVVGGDLRVRLFGLSVNSKRRILRILLVQWLHGILFDKC